MSEDEDRYSTAELDRYEASMARRLGVEVPTSEGVDGHNYARARGAIRRAWLASQAGQEKP